MRILCLVISFILIFTFSANAKSYLIYDSSTKEIISLSNEDDAQLEEGQLKEILDVKFKDIKLTAPPTDYKYVDGDFVKNLDKISDKLNEIAEGNERAEEYKTISKMMEKIAFDELKKNGKTFKHYKTEDFE